MARAKVKKGIKVVDPQLPNKFFSKLEKHQIPFLLEVRIRTFWADLYKRHPHINLPKMKVNRDYIIFDWFTSEKGVSFDFSIDKCYWTTYNISGHINDSASGFVSKPTHVLSVEPVDNFFKDFIPLQFC